MSNPVDFLLLKCFAVFLEKWAGEGWGGVWVGERQIQMINTVTPYSKLLLLIKLIILIKKMCSTVSRFG